MNPGVILAIAALIWVFIYTMSYGIWTWKKKNHLGGAAIIITALIAVVMPIWIIIARR